MAQILSYWMPFERSKLNLKQVQHTINKACQEANRRLNSVALLVVSKHKPIDALLPLLKEGHRLFGENRVQEASQKWPQIQNQYSNLELHLIGSLQTNKVKEAIELFDVIESVDRPRLVLELAKQWPNPKRRTQKIFIQVNTGHEPQKSGVLIEDLPALIEICRQHQLPLSGLMCIPPLSEDPSTHFRLLCDLAKEHRLSELSMGMSADFEKAIALGATIVRIGTALWQQ